MSEEEKKAIENINYDMQLLYGQHNVVNNEDLKIILKLLEKQSKVIDEMADNLYIKDAFSEFGNSREEIKQYFYRKVEEDE